MVELALSVITTADSRKDVSAVRIKHNHGHLGFGGVPLLFPEVIFVSEQLIHIGNSQRDCLHGDALELRVQRGVNAKTLRK